MGNFGENLTTEGLFEDQVHVGDEFRVGSARLVVTQPRFACFKLGLRFGDPAMVKTFVEARLPGIYFAVLEEGAVAPGDRIEQVTEGANQISVTEAFRLILDDEADSDQIRRLLEVPALAPSLREEFEGRLALRDVERPER